MSVASPLHITKLQAGLKKTLFILITECCKNKNKIRKEICRPKLESLLFYLPELWNVKQKHIMQSNDQYEIKQTFVTYT